MARALAVFGFCGSTLIVLAVVLPGAHSNRVAVLGCAAVAYLLTAVLWFSAEALPTWAIQTILGTGTLLLTIMVAAGGDLAAPLTTIYVWTALYAFCFLSTRAAVAQAVLTGVCCAVVAPRSVGDPAAWWLLTVGTVVIAGAWTRRLVMQVDDLARTDPLTGVPNRRAWDEELPRAVAVSRREHTRLALVLLDLDHFKVYNDEHGHQAGDHLLRETVGAWRAALREVDVMARYGGEEFAVLLPGCPLGEAHVIAERLRAVMPGMLTCSAGVAGWDGAEPAESLFARADAALYEAKHQGRARTVVAPAPDAAPDAALADITRWTATVVDVLDRAEVDVVFQPIVQLVDGAVIGHESLARPVGAAARLGVEGMFSTAQRMGRIRDLDWLCRRAAVVGARHLPPSLPLFMNVSAASLLDPVHDTDQMLLLLRWAQRPPQQVILEVTERETITDVARLAEVVTAYRTHGFRFAVDDVGSGHSTLEVLANVMPEYVKVAAVLTRNATLPGPAAAVVAAVAFARAAGAAVVAEGIEDLRAASLMHSLGVAFGQGYALGAPRPAVPVEQAASA